MAAAALASAANGLNRKRGAQRAPDHQLNDLRIRHMIHGVGTDCSAVAEDRERRAKGAHFVHAMGDQDYCRAGTLEPFDHVTEPLHVAFRQRCGWLVEQQDPRVTADRAGNFYFLSRRQIESAHFRARIDRRDAQRLEPCVDNVVARPPAHHTERIERLLHKQEVLRDREVLYQRYFLERGADSELIGKPRFKARETTAKNQN